MIDNIEHKKQVLEELYREYCNNSNDGKGDGMTFREYVEREAENDPDFYNFLYDEVLGGVYPSEAEMKEDLEELINY